MTTAAAIALATVISLAAEVAADFRAFAGLLAIRTKAGGLIQFSYDRWHAEQVRFEAERTGMDLVLKARQIGFSTLELARDVWFALRTEGVNVQIVSHDSDLCEQMFRDVTRMVDGLVALRLIPQPKSSNVREVVFAHNGSAIRIVEAGATDRVAAKRGRSGTIHRLHCTELAFWGAAKETMTALRAACAPNAEVVVESTANGASGLFYEMVCAALEGRGEYRLHFFAWHEHAEYRAPVPVDLDPTPRDDHELAMRAAGCDDEQITWWRQLVDAPDRGGLERVLQEYPYAPLLAFRMPSGRWIDPSLVDWCTKVAARPVRTERVVVELRRNGASIGTRDIAECRWFAEPSADDIVIGVDIGSGGGGDADASVARARERKTGRLVASIVTNTVEPGDFGLAAAWLARKCNGALVGIERNNHGHAAIRSCTTEDTSVTPYARLYRAPDDKLGWHTTPQTRPVMWDEWHSWLRAARTSNAAERLMDATAAHEMRTLVLDDGKPQAATGAHDDVFTADAIAWQLRVRSSPPRRDEGGERYRSEADRAGSLV